MFNIDAILNDAGHSVLLLPLYHPDLNPIEMAWFQIKGYVASKNVSWNLTQITDLIKEKVSVMGQTEWGKLCSKVKQIEADYCQSDHVVDMMTETFINRVEDDDEMATRTNTASTSFQITQDDLMEGVSTLI